MRLTDFLTELGSPVAYYPKLTKITGGVKETIFLCQLLYWQGKQGSKDGWIYKTQQEFTEETGLSRWEQETARKNLVRKGFLETKYSGIPRRLYFRLNIENINKAWAEFVSSDKHVETQHTSVWENHMQECGNPTYKDVETPHTSVLKSNKQACGNTTDKHVEIPHAITENTTEITTKITSENTSETTTESIEYIAQSCKSISEPTAAANDDPPLVVIPLNGKTKEFPITQQMIDDWQKDFPSVDVLSELRKMHAWSEANPNKRKTIKGVKRFIVNWLSREQDRIKSSSVGGGSAAVNSGYSRHPQNLRLVNNMDAVRGFLEDLEREKQGKEAAW